MKNPDVNNTDNSIKVSQYFRIIRTIVIMLMIFSGVAKDARADNVVFNLSYQGGGTHLAYLDMKGDGSVAIATSGEVISSSVDFQIWNQAGCPGCIDQIVIGIGSDAQTCVYQGIPGLYPGKLGKSQFFLTAPTVPGTYDIRFRMTQQYNCSEGRASYEAGDIDSYEIIGRLTVANPEGHSLVLSSISLNGREDTITIMIGAQVTVMLDYQLWSQPECPWCVNQIVLGIDHDAQACAFDDITYIYPGYSGTSSTVLTAPMTPGTYYVRYRITQQLTCSNGQANYEGGELNQTVRIAKLVVVDANDFVTNLWDLQMNGSRDMITSKPGQPISGSVKYQIWNPSSCIGCIDQIVLGIDHDAQACAYNGVPNVAPGRAGNSNFILTAPQSPGIYYVRTRSTMASNCIDGQAWYEGDGIGFTQKIGTILVTPWEIYLPIVVR
jgi:hypothetical protein